MLTKAPTTELQDTPHIDGRTLRHLSPRKRGQLAAGLVKHRHLSCKAASEACLVSTSTVRRELTRNGNGTQAAAAVTVPAIVGWWDVATPRQRVALIDRFGAAETWDALSAVIDD